MSLPGEEIRANRIKKLGLLKEKKINPYPAKADFGLSEISGVRENFKKLLAKKTGIAGRVMAKREHGNSMFLDIFDGTAKLQVFVGKDKLAEGEYELLRDALDIGDFAAFLGKPFYTKRKEPTIEAERWQMLAKTLRPLPEKWHGLQDVEERFRKRYLDILMNPDVAARLELRSRLVKEIRSVLDGAGFLEVETPILQPQYGGALAEPFKTHHRMLDIDMYLRVAPELYLKRLLVAGFPKVYELGKNFRNEGIDMTHNPEFTTVELYAAYWDAEALKKFIGEALYSIIKKINKKSSFIFKEQKIDFPKKIPSIEFWSVLERHAGIVGAEKLSREDLALRAKQFGINVESHESKEKIANEIFSKICRPKMIQPVFLVGHPLAISPLAKELSGKPDLVDRFQLIIGGVEMVNGFSELNDPLEQRKRMEAQEKMREAGEKEAEPMDEDFIEALEYGMPPAAGLAVSIDRLTMLLGDIHNIKEVILFPTMKPRLDSR
ncbi:MAG: lysine--tRNA ligase [bacterium]|nr:lysine--tRNA ligase [bacterium]